MWLREWKEVESYNDGVKGYDFRHTLRIILTWLTSVDDIIPSFIQKVSEGSPLHPLLLEAVADKLFHMYATSRVLRVLLPQGGKFHNHPIAQRR